MPTASRSVPNSPSTHTRTLGDLTMGDEAETSYPTTSYRSPSRHRCWLCLLHCGATYLWYGS
jgi:hypothetical protein